MKKILLATTLALVSATSAFAFTHDTGFNSADMARVYALVPAADLSNLTMEQADALDTFLSRYNDNSDEDGAARIRLILSQG